MKKITFAVLALMASGFAMAEPYTATEGEGAVTTRSSAPSTYTYTVADAAGDRLFVKNNFDFTLSANVLMTAGEEAEGRFMVVGTTNTQGRNFYIGHSDGGSVSACGDALSATEAKTADFAALLATRFDSTTATGCASGEAPAAGGGA